MLKKLHHSGFAVNNLEDSIKFFVSIGFKLEKQFEKTDEKAKAAFMKLDNSSIEIWELENSGTDFAKVIKKHTAFESDYIEEDLKKFLNAGYSIAIPLTEGITVKKYVYLKDMIGNYIEILEVN